MGYYSEFNAVDRTISFTPLAASNKEQVYSEEKPSRNLGISWLKVGLLAGGIFICVVMTTLLCLAYRRGLGPLVPNKATKE